MAATYTSGGVTYTVVDVYFLNPDQQQCRFGKTALYNIAPTKEEANKTIINGNNVVKNVYLESFIIPIISIAAEAPALPAIASVQSKEWRYYYNSSDDKLYYTKPVLTNGEVTGMTNWAVKSDFTVDTPMQNHVGLILVNETDNKLYHWHNNRLNQVGGADIAEATSTHTTVNEVTTTSYNLGTVTLSTISEIARRMASEMITSAQEGNFDDQLYSYDEITN